MEFGKTRIFVGSVRIPADGLTAVGQQGCAMERSARDTDANGKTAIKSDVLRRSAFETFAYAILAVSIVACAYTLGRNAASVPPRDAESPRSHQQQIRTIRFDEVQVDVGRIE